MGLLAGYNDKVFGALYLAALLATICWGLTLKASSNDLFWSIDAAYLAHPYHCPATPGPGARAPTASQLKRHNGLSSLALLFKQSVLLASFFHAWRSIAGCMLLGLGTALLSAVLALRVCASPRLHSLLKASICLAVRGMGVLIPALTTIFMIYTGSTAYMPTSLFGVVYLVISTVLTVMAIYLARRGRLKKCVRLLQLAATHVLSLTGTVPILAGVCAVGAAGGGLMIYLQYVAAMLGHGRLVSNGLPHVFGQYCLAPGEEGHAACCLWEPPSGAWFRAYVMLNSVTRVWSVFLLEKFVRFVVGGGVSALAASVMLGQGGAAETHPVSLAPHAAAALGRSFGSLCKAALLHPLQLKVQLMGVLQHALAQGGRMQGVSATLGKLTYAAAPYLSKFAPARMAVTGDPFFVAGRDATCILSSRSLKVYHSWALPPVVCYVNAAVSAMLTALAIATVPAASAVLLGLLDAYLAVCAFFLLSEGLMFITLLYFFFAAVVVLAGLDALYLVYASMHDDDLAAREDWAGEAAFARSVREAFEDAPVRELASVTAQFQHVRPCDDGQSVSLMPMLDRPQAKEPPSSLSV